MKFVKILFCVIVFPIGIYFVTQHTVNFVKFMDDISKYDEA